MKRSIKHMISVVLLTIVSSVSIGQTGQEYFERINSNYSGLVSMELLLNYKLYRGSNVTDIIDEYENTVRIAEGKSHKKVYTDEIITSEGLMLVLDHEFKTIQISLDLNEESDLFDKDIKESLKNFQDVQITARGDLTELLIVFTEHSQSAYSQIKLVVDKDFWIESMTLYYAIQMNFSQDSFNPDMGYPRLQIDYLNFNKKWKDKEGLTDITHYVELDNGFYKPTSLYTGYEIIDTRN